MKHPSRFWGLVSGTMMGGLNTGTDFMKRKAFRQVLKDDFLAWSAYGSADGRRKKRVFLRVVCWVRAEVLRGFVAVHFSHGQRDFDNEWVLEAR